MKQSDILERLIFLLSERGIKASLFKKAQSGSIYMEFEDPRMGKCRIGDHKERDKYGYRWHVRMDITEYFIFVGKGHNQFFYPVSRLEDAVDHMKNYQEMILKNSS